jgi:hypothetical protein
VGHGRHPAGNIRHVWSWEMAKARRRAQSPATRASFLARDQRFTCASRRRASPKVVHPRLRQTTPVVHLRPGIRGRPAGRGVAQP